VPPAVVLVVFNHRGDKFIKKIELPNFLQKNIHLVLPDKSLFMIAY